MSDNDDLGWREALPEEMRELPFIGKAKDLNEAINGIKNAAETMGNSLRMPGPNAGDEDVKTFTARVLEKMPGLMPVPNPDDEEGYATVLQRLGAPADPKAYKAPDVADFVWPEGTLEGMRAQAQKAGLTQKQFTQYAQQVGEELKTSTLNRSQTLDANMAAIKQEWGQAFDQRQQQITQFLDSSKAPEGLRDAVKNGTADPDTLRWLHATAVAKAGEKPEGADQGSPGGEPGAPTPEEAKAQIQEIFNNPEYFKPGPVQQQLMKKMLELQKFATG